MSTNPTHPEPDAEPMAAVRDDDPTTEAQWQALQEWFDQQDAAREAAENPPATELQIAQHRLGLAWSDLGHAQTQARAADAYGWLNSTPPDQARDYLTAAIRERDAAAADMARLTGEPIENFRDHAVHPNSPYWTTLHTPTADAATADAATADAPTADADDAAPSAEPETRHAEAHPIEEFHDLDEDTAGS